MSGRDSRFVVLLGLVVCCSCSTPDRHAGFTPAKEIPPDVPMSRWAGQGVCLWVELRLEDGEKFSCVVDTGAPGTTVPSRLEAKLGKRLGKGKHSNFGSVYKVHYYEAPKLYLGDVALVTGDRVATADHGVVLGMDCLRHYCLQLDFHAREVRFLRPDEVNPAELGRAYPLLDSPYAMIRHAGLLDDHELDLIVDTGHGLDGYLDPEVFEREVKTRPTKPPPVRVVDAQGRTLPAELGRVALFAECVWDGETYTDLLIEKGEPKEPNLIGLRFLGRHLVTFDFPGRTMYLKRVSSGPLGPEVTRHSGRAEQDDGGQPSTGRAVSSDEP